jgi:hypothetical protein
MSLFPWPELAGVALYLFSHNERLLSFVLKKKKKLESTTPTLSNFPHQNQDLQLTNTVSCCGIKTCISY